MTKGTRGYSIWIAMRRRRMEKMTESAAPDMYFVEYEPTAEKMILGMMMKRALR
jgi:hypothetical protein